MKLIHKVRVKKPKPENSRVFYRGASEIDGKKIVGIISGLVKDSDNSKTGALPQIWILVYDTKPYEAARTGADYSICGDCPLRKSKFIKGEVSDKPCYLELSKAPRAVWSANRDKDVIGSDELRTILDGRRVRRGAYGDPMAIPQSVWVEYFSGIPGTGYTHQWELLEREMIEAGTIEPLLELAA
jgi:hypothetical protein